MQAKIKIRLNMTDTFSHCTDSRELSVTPERLERLKQYQSKGTIGREHTNNITYNWRLDKIELL